MASLTDDDKRDVAQACRAFAVQAEQDAAAQNNPSVKAGFLKTAERFRALADRFERARKPAGVSGS